VAQHQVGDVVEGRVTKIVAFGAFVEIYEGIEGLVHISELANRHVERPDEVVSVSQIVQVKIIEVDSERRRLSLSIKRVDGDNVKPLRPLAPPESEGGADEAEAEEIVEAIETIEEAEEIVEAAAAVEVAAEIVAAEIESAETVEELVEALEDAAVVDAAADIVAEAAEEFVAEHEPELGLSDDVFPAGGKVEDEAPEAETTDEAKTDDEAAPEA